MGDLDQTSSSLPKDLFLWLRGLQQITCLIVLLGLVIYEILPVGHRGTRDKPLPDEVAHGLQKVLIEAGFVSPRRCGNAMTWKLTHVFKAWYIGQIADPWAWRSVYRLANPLAGTIPISKDTCWQMRPLYRKVTGSSATLLGYGATIAIPLLLTVAIRYIHEARQ